MTKCFSRRGVTFLMPPYDRPGSKPYIYIKDFRESIKRRFTEQRKTEVNDQTVLNGLG